MKSVLILIATLTAMPFVNAQSMKYIQLKQDAVNYSPKGFYISDVADDRGDKSSIGLLSGGGGNEPIELQGGAASTIKNYITHNVMQDNNTQPAVLRISKIDVKGRKSGNGWSISAAMTVVFSVADKKVVEYSGNGHGEVDGDPGDFIEGFIRTAIENDLKRFDGWWAQNKGQVATSSAVKVNVTMGRTTDKPNCIVYSLGRPLSIADFEGPAEQDIAELAATFSGIGMGYSGKTQNGQLVIDVIVTPYFDRTGSWFKEAGKNPRVLAHEQAHFDITGIKACELIAAIRNATLTQENFSAVLNGLQKENAKESNEEEALYDTETNHGTIEDKQLEWEKKIKEKVRGVGCY